VFARCARLPSTWRERKRPFRFRRDAGEFLGRSARIRWSIVDCTSQDSRHPRAVLAAASKVRRPLKRLPGLFNVNPRLAEFRIIRRIVVVVLVRYSEFQMTRDLRIFNRPLVVCLRTQDHPGRCIPPYWPLNAISRAFQWQIAFANCARRREEKMDRHAMLSALDRDPIATLILEITQWSRQFLLLNILLLMRVRSCCALAEKKDQNDSSKRCYRRFTVFCRTLRGATTPVSNIEQQQKFLLSVLYFVGESCSRVDSISTRPFCPMSVTQVQFVLFDLKRSRIPPAGIRSYSAGIVLSSLRLASAAAHRDRKLDIAWSWPKFHRRARSSRGQHSLTTEFLSSSSSPVRFTSAESSQLLEIAIRGQKFTAARCSAFGCSERWESSSEWGFRAIAKYVPRFLALSCLADSCA